MSLSVREAVVSEYQRIGDLTVAAFMSNGMAASSPYAGPLRDAEGRARHSLMLVAVDDDSGKVLGAVSFVRAGSPLDDMCRQDESEFRMLAVDPTSQGVGAGRALVTKCLERASACGSRAVVIRVADTALAARHLYERFGFGRISDRDHDLDEGPRLLAYRLSLSTDGGTAPGQ